MAEETAVLEQQPAPVAEPSATPSAAEPPAQPPAAAPDPKDRRGLLVEAIQKNNRGQHAQRQPREQGKFAGPPQAPAQAAAPVVPAVQRPAMPKSLKKELEQHWNAAPAELAAAVHQRELDYEKGVQPLKEAKAQLDDLLSEFKPYEMLLRAEHSTPKQAIGNLMRTAAILRTGTPAQKAQSVATVMQQFGIPLQHIQQVLSGQALPQQSAVEPQNNALAQQVQQINERLAATEQQSQQAVIRRFAADQKHKHFETVKESMSALLSAPGVLGDIADKTEDEILELAYDAAIRLNPTLYAQVQAEQQVTQQTRQQVSHAKNAAVQVNGAPQPGPATAPNPKDRREFIRNQMRRVQ